MSGGVECQGEAADFALGLLDAECSRAFERHLEECPECAAGVRDFRECAASLAYLSAAAPPAQLRERLLMETRPLPAGVSASRSNEGVWVDTPFPGIACKPLYKHPQTGQATQLFRLNPGAAFPRHFHSGDEQCLVVEGEVEIGAVRFHAGDFSVAQAGTTHDVVSTQTGCLLLIVSSPA